MGCWNGTCMISNLPIRYGEPVVGFIIEYINFSEEFMYSGTCNSNAIARTISLPIYGKYNDYGNIEKINTDDIAVKHLLHLFNEKNIDTLLHDIERDKKTIFSNYAEKNVDVGLVMINNAIFNRLISSHEPDEHIPDNNTIINELKAFRKLKPMTTLELNKAMKNGEKISAEDIKNSLSCMSSTLLGIHIGISEHAEYVDMIKFIISLNKKHNKKIANDFATAIRQRLIIIRKVDDLRKLWIGPSGKGSQSNDYKIHLILAEAIRESIFNSFDGPEEAYRQLLGDKDY